MKRKTIIILFIISLLVILSFVLFMKFIGYYSKEDKGFVGFCGRLLNKTNEFKITYSNVNKNDFDVLWHTDEYSDTLVRKGETINNFGYDYGPERFIVLYKNKILCSNGIWSTNNNDIHNVEINIEKVSDGFIVTYLLDSDKAEVHIDSKGNRITK